MDGLRKALPDEKERKAHILHKMLLMSEIDSDNADDCKQIFGVQCKNMYEGDTLTMDILKTFGVDKFDVIVGNPPYNKGGVKSSSGKLLGDKNETIWHKFVAQCLKLLNPNGYLVFIHPLSCLRKSHSVHDKLLETHPLVAIMG